MLRMRIDGVTATAIEKEKKNSIPRESGCFNCLKQQKSRKNWRRKKKKFRTS